MACPARLPCIPCVQLLHEPPTLHQSSAHTTICCAAGLPCCKGQPLDRPPWKDWSSLRDSMVQRELATPFEPLAFVVNVVRPLCPEAVDWVAGLCGTLCHQAAAGYPLQHGGRAMQQCPTRGLPSPPAWPRCSCRLLRPTPYVQAGDRECWVSVSEGHDICVAFRGTEARSLLSLELPCKPKP